MHGKSCLSLSTLNLLPFKQNHPELERLTTLSYHAGDLGAYLTEIVLGVSRFVQSDWTIVTICEGEIGQIAASSLDMDHENMGFSMHGTLAEEVVQSGRSLIIEDSRQNGSHRTQTKEYHAYLGVPLKTSNGAVIGTICSFLRKPSSFTESEIKMVELFAERAATAIENYRLYQQQLRFNETLSQQFAACSIDLKISQEKLIERERLAAIGEFVTMIVHEVRNPLTTIQLGLRYAQKVLNSNADQQRITLALSESHRLNHLLNQILCYSKPQVLQLSKLKICEFLENFLAQIRDLPEAAERHITYVKRFPDVEIMGDADKLKQVFLNLFRNAFEAISSQETVSCLVSNSHRSNWICISLHNGGTPIPSDLLPQLTTPFCSTKPSGTGLGLAISKRIITAHGGELEIASSIGGTTVSIHLPLST